jgi:hypothetical protein
MLKSEKVSGVNKSLDTSCLSQRKVSGVGI